MAGRETVKSPRLKLGTQRVREHPPGFFVDVARDEAVGERGNHCLLCAGRELWRRGGSLLSRLSAGRDRHPAESSNGEEQQRTSCRRACSRRAFRHGFFAARSLTAVPGFSRKALDHFLGETALLQSVLDLVENRQDIAPSCEKTVTLRGAKHFPDTEQVGGHAAAFWCEGKHAPARIVFIADGADDSGRDHLVGDADHAWVCETQAGGDLADREG